MGCTAPALARTGVTPKALARVTGDFDPDAWAGVAAVYRRSGVVMQVRPLDQVNNFFDGVQLIDLGVVSLPAWHPGPPEADSDGPPGDAAVSAYGGLGRKL